VLGSNPSESGGYNDVTFAIKGEGAYSIFKWEGGTHRVQRVPVTESQGAHPHVDGDRRRHARGRGGRGRDRSERPQDRRLPLDRARRPEREHDRLGRADHAPPTGLVVAMQDEKSQLQNKTKALRVLRARLLELERSARRKSSRRAPLADRPRRPAEKIRTYNYPDNRSPTTGST
jgi:peptide chain release factor 1